MSVAPSERGQRPWPDYHAVWRWHFYAGLFCIPFVCWLAITGSIYLWKPQVEAWLDRPYAHLADGRARIPPSAEVRAALAAEPGSVLHAYQIPAEPGAAAEVLVGRGAGESRVWVDPRDGRMIKAVPEDARFMNVIFHLHGELLLGDRGSMVVELAGSWAVIMILTGLFLWWPRGATGPGGVLYPRIGGGSRLFWRDLHACAGVWVSALALLFLFSGLPWAKSWGGYLGEVRRLSGQAILRQDWTTGRDSELKQRMALSAGSLAGQTAMHAGRMTGMNMGPASPINAMPVSAYGAIDRMVPTVAALALPRPVLIGPPTSPGGPWSARSDTQDRPLRVNLTLDPVSGAVLRREGFAQQTGVDQVVAVGVAGHEGQLFGWPNQLLNLFTATGLLTVSVSAVVLWLKRRPAGRLGAPEPGAAPRFAAGLLAIVVALGVLLPLFGASLIVVAILERSILIRVGPLRAWLGLRGGPTAMERP